VNILLLFLSLFILFSFDQENLIIEGYCSKVSASPGDSLTVFVNAGEKRDHYDLKLFDLEGKQVATYKANVFSQEPQHDKPWQHGYGYKPSLKIKVPYLKSGVYQWEDRIPLIIKTAKPKIVVVYNSNRENAYCNGGGKSLYAFNSSESKPTHTVSFLRPMRLPRHAEPFLRWFETQPFKDVGYIADVDLDNYDAWSSAELLIITGHSEYWTLQARKNFDRFVNEGKNAIVLSGNTMWWQVRYSKDKTQMICYKSKDDDPIANKKLKTINWNDPKLNYPITKSIGVEFPNAGYGRKTDKGWDGFKILTHSPLLEGTTLKVGDILPLPSDETDGVSLLGFTHEGHPIANTNALGFEKMEIVGYDKVFRLEKEGYATWVVFKRSKKSGVIINTVTTDWCSSQGISNQNVKIITLNMIKKLMAKQNVFSQVEAVHAK
jgi:hypothetical protein